MRATASLSQTNSIAPLRHSPLTFRQVNARYSRVAYRDTPHSNNRPSSRVWCRKRRALRHRRWCIHFWDNASDPCGKSWVCDERVPDRGPKSTSLFRRRRRTLSRRSRAVFVDTFRESSANTRTCDRLCLWKFFRRYAFVFVWEAALAEDFLCMRFRNLINKIGNHKKF